ncbi:hypothetical protein LINPERPRIM_LOCUS12538 [Linum perenne]
MAPTTKLNNKSTLLTAAILLLIATEWTLADSAQCGVNVSDVVAKCKDYVKKGAGRKAPSKECCGVVKGADVKCACKSLLTPDIQAIINMDNVVYVGRSCGLSFPAGMKCGPYVVPPELRR